MPRNEHNTSIFIDTQFKLNTLQVPGQTVLFSKTALYNSTVVHIVNDFKTSKIRWSV